MNSISSRASVPNPTPLLFVMAAIVVWYKWGEDPTQVSAAAAGILGAIVAAGVVYVLSTRPVRAVIALVAAGTMARLNVEIFGMKARPEHFAIVLVCLAVPFWPRQQWRRPRWILPDLLLVLYMASNLVSSLVMSIAPRKTLTWAVQQVLVILPYFLLRLFCTDRERLRKAFMILLAVGAVKAAIGVLCFLSNLFFGSEFGMEIGQYGSIPGTYGLNYEANILGSISAAAFVMMLATYLKERRLILLWGIAITYSGMLIALSRAALVAAFIALGLIIAVSIKTKLLDMSAGKVLARTLLLANLVLLPLVAPLYLDRFSTLDVSDVSADGDTVVRVVTLVSASDGILAHPIMGNGTSSFQLEVSMQDLGFGEDVTQSAWIGNTEMRVLHDTGILGLTVFFFSLGSLILRARKILKRELRLELMALLTAFAVYALTFQATEGTLLEFFWVHIGLLGCAVSVYQNSPSKQAGAKVGGDPGDACA